MYEGPLRRRESTTTSMTVPDPLARAGSSISACDHPYGKARQLQFPPGGDFLMTSAGMRPQNTADGKTAAASRRFSASAAAEKMSADSEILLKEPSARTTTRSLGPTRTRRSRCSTKRSGRDRKAFLFKVMARFRTSPDSPQPNGAQRAQELFDGFRRYISASTPSMRNVQIVKGLCGKVPMPCIQPVQSPCPSPSARRPTASITQMRKRRGTRRTRDFVSRVACWSAPAASDAIAWSW